MVERIIWTKKAKTDLKEIFLIGKKETNQTHSTSNCFRLLKHNRI